MARTRRIISYLLYFITTTLVLGDTCPYQECQCDEDVIECENLSLTSLPTLVVADVSWQPYLTLNTNSITSITANGLPSGLSGIDFENNPITNIDPAAFEGSSETLTDLKFSGGSFQEFPFAFFYLNKLQHLSIKDTLIQQWDPDVLLHLGDTLQTLTLVNVGLTFWPTWVHSLVHVTALELSGARMTVPADGFNNLTHSLWSITMENISLTSTNGIFSKLGYLFDIILDNNNITQISGLPGFGNLSTLSLNNNNISDRSNLSDAMRPVASSLSTLYLNGNKLTTLPDLDFMLKLENVFLSENLISNTETGSIPSSLTFLGLENNNIATLSKFMRNGHKLNMVRLSSNYVTELEGVDIPTSITDMDISNNLIVGLTSTSFPYNSSMVVLTLDFNPLSSISQSTFVNTPRLTHLSIKSTKLSRLPLALADLNSLNQLDLSDNTHLVCTCMENDLRPWSLQYYLVIVGDCGSISIEDFLQSLSVDCPS